MNNIFAFLLAILLLLCACSEVPAEPEKQELPSESSSSEQEEEPTEEEPALPKKEYSVTVNLHYTEKGFVHSGYPQIYGDEIFFSDDQHDGRDKGKKGNVFSYNTVTGEIVDYGITTYQPFYYHSGIIYYMGEKGLSAYNIKSKTTEIFDIPFNGSYLSLLTFYKGNILLCDWYAVDEGTHRVYNFNIETEEIKAVIDKMKTELDPFYGMDLRVKNGFVSYSHQTEKGYELRAVNLETGRNIYFKTLEKEPRRVVYNGEYLLWSDKQGIHLIHNEEESIITTGDRDVDIINGNFVIYSNSKGEISIYDLIGEKKIFDFSESYPEIRLDSWFAVTEDGPMVFSSCYHNAYQNDWYRNTLYPDWNWDSMGQYAEAPEFFVTIDEIFEVTEELDEESIDINELFTFAEGVEVIPLETEEYYANGAIESEKSLIFFSGNTLTVLDKETGELIYKKEYPNRIWRMVKASDREGFDYKIFRTNSVTYLSFDDPEKFKEVPIANLVYIDKQIDESEYFDSFGENLVYHTRQGIALKKGNSEQKIILEHGLFPTLKDFFEAAGLELEYPNGVDGSFYSVSTYLVDPRFICNGTKIAVSVNSAINEGVSHGTLIYNLKTEKIEYVFGRTKGIVYGVVIKDDEYVATGENTWYSAKNGKAKKYDVEHLGLEYRTTVGNLAVCTQGENLYMGGPNKNFGVYTYNLETGEKTYYIEPKNGSSGQLLSSTESYFIIAVESGDLREVYAIKYR